jgi:ribonuclease HI
MWQMSGESLVYYGFTYDASRHTRNLDFTTWVIYSPTNQLEYVGGVCLGETTNNVTKYSVVIELLQDALSHGIQHLQVFLDSQLVVSHLNGLYSIRDPVLLRRFLRVHLLEQSLEFVTYEHVPRHANLATDAYVNYVLDLHLSRS